ncbi:MAG: lantibiotic dehydratase [Blastocatellia bacterium]
MIEKQKPAAILPSVESEPVNGRPLPDHLLALSDGKWALWRWVGLRGAGFPCSLPLKLSAPECAAAADHLLDVEDSANRARDRALDALRHNPNDSERQLELRKARRALKKDRLPESLNASDGARVLIEAFRDVLALTDRASAEFSQAYDAALEQTSQAVCSIAEMGSFREAIIWQNRHAFQTSIKTVTANAPRRQKQRASEELVANYLQRYCLKNDTIGFFGPVGWAKLNPQGERLRVETGENLIASREVYFEGWCIDALAKSLSRNRQILPWVAPRRIPPVYLDGATLYLPFRPPAKIPVKHAAVLQSCDGDRIARQLVADLRRTHPSLFDNEKEVYEILEALNGMGLVAWTLEVPVASHPERLLRQQIERIGDESLRLPAVKALDELECSRRVVAASAGDAEALDSALGDLESTFTRLTSMASTRNEGKTYAGRTLIYEDCRRDIEIDVGPEIIRSLEPPLSLLLTSARWMSFQMASAFREFCKKLYAEFVERTGSSVIDAANFVNRASIIINESKSTPVDVVAGNLQQRWSKILAFAEDERHVQFTSKELLQPVMDAFDAPNPGWAFARYHCPDIMISARSVEAIRSGDYQLVMGELHQAANTLIPALWMEQHPAKEELMRAFDLDMNQPRLVPLKIKSMPDSNSRTIIGLHSSRDLFLATAPDAFGAPPSRTVPIGSLVVDSSNGELIIRSRDGRLRFEIIEALASLMSTLASSSFKLLPPRAHSPRITIDQLVVCRETWRTRASEMKFAFEKDEAARYLGARRWARGLGVPRFVFAKTPVEMKPFYIDFSSLVYVNILAKMIRRTVETGGDAEFAISEMLPSHDGIWLPDNKGQRFTSEFRIVALDLQTESDSRQH